MFKPYSEENELLNAQYRQHNYIIREHKRQKNGKVYVYFSGNGLYQADNEESFRSLILERDRYEWLHYSAKKIPEKEIYIRDIWLSWYCKGINVELNSIDKVAAWLRKECAGYRVTLIGNSAGGYMAVNCALRMPGMVDRVFSLCGQYSLLNHNDHVRLNPLLARYYNEEDFECYKKLNQISNIYYLFSGGVDHDVAQYEFVKDINSVRSFEFASKRHGTTAHNFDYPELFSLSNEELDLLYEKTKNSILTDDYFSVVWYGKTKLLFKKTMIGFFKIRKKVLTKIGSVNKR